VYENNGFRIEVGFYEGKYYYEQFRKLDPQNPNSLLEITETERNWLLGANEEPLHGPSKWYRQILESPPQNGATHYKDVYEYDERNRKATYDWKVLTIRSLQVENHKKADEKKRLEENLKDFCPPHLAA
jgi:hypothetical protein